MVKLLQLIDEDGADMSGPGEKLHALDAAIKQCEQALATLDSVGLLSEGARLSFALDQLREQRELLRLSASDDGVSDSAGS